MTVNICEIIRTDRPKMIIVSNASLIQGNFVKNIANLHLIAAAAVLARP